MQNAHSNSEKNAHEENEELPDGDMHENSNAKRTNMETRKEPRLAKYVRRNHPTEQIIGNKEAKPITRNKLRNGTCLLSKVEPIIV